MQRFGKEQINDPHLEKLIYFEDASEVFPGVAIADGITIVFKNKLKTSDTFNYEYHDGNGRVQTVELQKPGEKLLILNPKDNSITQLMDRFISEHGLAHISDSSVINQKLFRIESSFVEDHPKEVRPFNDDSSIKNNEVKLLTNNKSGKGERLAGL